MKHTKEPWIVSKDKAGFIEDQRGEPIAIALRTDFETDVDATAQRIVDCVNALEGINPDAVPDLLKGETGHRGNN